MQTCSSESRDRGRTLNTQDLFAKLKNTLAKLRNRKKRMHSRRNEEPDESSETEENFSRSKPRRKNREKVGNK
jgi:hypothetical protein